MRHALLWFLQALAVLASVVLVYGLTFLVAPDGPWPARAAAGVVAGAGVYLGAIRSRPRPWLPEPPAPVAQPLAGEGQTRTSTPE